MNPVKLWHDEINAFWVDQESWEARVPYLALPAAEFEALLRRVAREAYLLARRYNLKRPVSNDLMWLLKERYVVDLAIATAKKTK